MTTQTIEETAMSRTDLARAGHLRGVAGVSRRLHGAGLTIGIWFWGVYALYAVGITVGNAVAGNDLEISALDATLGAARWPMLTLGVIASSAILTLHVAAGGSRRSLFVGVLRGAVVVGAGYGVVTTLALLGERLLSTSLGMTWHRLGALPFDSPLAVLGTTVAEALGLGHLRVVEVGPELDVGDRADHTGPGREVDEDGGYGEREHQERAPGLGVREADPDARTDEDVGDQHEGLGDGGAEHRGG